MRALCLAVAFVLVGCTGDVSEVPDAGAPMDAGGAVDGGAEVDAGTEPDAGTEVDAGAPRDAGAELDAGVTTDAGAPFDAGVVTATFSPSAADLPNPERGWYTWASSDFGASLDVGAVDAAYGQGIRLMYAMVDLQAFRTAPLSQPFLTALSARLATLRAHGMKAVLRFVYDYTAAGNDATATQISSHLQQLAPVLAANADAIAVFQAGFIGAWGEWHSSKNSNSFGYMTNAGVTEQQADANRLIVRDALLSAVPADLPVAFRYPGDLIKWYPSATQQARAGLHNDCWLAGPSDTGTYASQAERSYIAALSENATFGGETCDASSQLRTSCSDVRAEGARYHLAYLNREYFDGFFTAWMSGGCFDEVTRAMGYRLQLDAVRHPARARPGQVVRVEVALRNVGWAKVFSPRPLVVRLSGGGAHASQALLSSLPAQATTSTTVSVDVVMPMTAGDSALELAVPDVHATTSGDPRFAIRFANTDDGSQRWNATSATFATGTRITVE